MSEKHFSLFQGASREPDSISRRRGWAASQRPENQNAACSQDQRSGQRVLWNLNGNAPEGHRSF